MVFHCVPIQSEKTAFMNKDIPIALQLYSVRDDCASRGLPAVLREVAQMGYAGVEFAGYYGMAAKDLRAQLDDNGLAVAGTHTKIDDLLGDAFLPTVEYNREIGNRYVICPGLPEAYRDSIDAWKKTADLFNDLSVKLAEHGMLIGYHNHTHEFVPMDGILPWDVFYGNTRNEVIMQLDTGNALAGGTDVTPFIEKYPNRSITVHLKEQALEGDAKPVIGEGDVNWQEIFRLCREVGGTKWYIVEQESYAHPPMECVRLCLERVREMLEGGK